MFIVLKVSHVILTKNGGGSYETAENRAAYREMRK